MGFSSIYYILKLFEDSVVQMEKSNAPYFLTALFSRPLSQLRAEKQWTEKFIEKLKEEESLLTNFVMD